MCIFSFQCHCSGKDCNEKMDFGSRRRNRSQGHVNLMVTEDWISEYLNGGPDGMCSPLVGGSLHSWNQLILWKEAERPLSFDGQCSSHMIGILREVLGLTVMAGLFLPGPDFNLELYPKTFLFFLPLSFLISLNPFSRCPWILPLYSMQGLGLSFPVNTDSLG